MRPEQVTAALRVRPFQPFRIYVTDGRSYDIRHPDMVMVSRHYLIIGLPNPSGHEDYYETTATVSLLHVTGTEPIVPPAPAASS
jgi:hypothetical protein